MQRHAPKTGLPLAAGADGLAVSLDGWLYFTPLSSRRLYRVRADHLAAGNTHVEDLGDKGFASDGLLVDAQNRLYATDVEKGAVRRRLPSGKWELLARGEPLSWPDTMTLLPSGRLLVTATQIHRGENVRARDERTRAFHVVLVRLPPG
ncbi:MAG: hypothetical protein JNK82_08865 [Myxococcaceae bacterium]|nr:hypothetical protein [Myxococcaceae bacterium]